MAPAKDAARASERVIIGDLFGGGPHAPEIFASIEPAYLAGEHAAAVFEALRAVIDSGKYVSIDRVRGALGDNGADFAWLESLLRECATLATSTLEPIEEHIQRVRQDFFYRTFHNRSGRARNAAELAHTYEDGLKFNAQLTRDRSRSPAEIVDALLGRQQAILDGDELAGYSWGLSGLDRYTRILPGGLHLVCGLAKSGKSHWALHTIEHNLRHGVPVKLFSLEMGPDEVWRRLLAKRARVDSAHILTPDLPGSDFDLLKAEAVTLREQGTPLDIDEDSAPSAADIVNRARLWKYKNKVPDGSGIVVVDFLQLLKLDRQRGETGSEVLKAAAYTLARMAKDLRVAVILVCQLNRRAESEEPSTAHLEGSGGPVQAAHSILFMDPGAHELRRQGNNPNEARRQDGSERMRIILAAQRFGVSYKRIKCAADFRYSEFFETTDEYDDGGEWNG